MGTKSATAPIEFVRRIVLNVTRRYPAHIDRDELIGEGLLRLVEARKRFDDTRGTQFDDYVTHRIRGAVLDWVRRNDPVPRQERRRAIQNGEILLPFVVSNEGEVDRAADTRENAAALIEQEEESKLQLERLHLALGQLSERERQVLSLRFVDGFKFEQIARELDSSNSRAAQIAWGAIHRLRAVMTGQELPPKSIYKKKRRKMGTL